MADLQEASVSDVDAQALAIVQNKLEQAGSDLAEAEQEIRDAERILEQITPREFRISVLYNGISKPFDVRPEEQVKALLDKAIHEFGPIPNPHTLALFNEQGQELDDAKTIKDAGLKPHDKLLLRPSTVKGGA